MKNRFASFLRLCFLLVLIAGAIFQPQYSVYALTTLTVTPLTWNVIGLDSNNVNVGPNHFPVGARVCNTGSEAATNVTATFVWDDGLNLYAGDPYINLRAGTLSTINLGTLNPGSCATNYLDFYFEVAVTRNASAYNKTRDYHINVTAGNVTGTISTPTPRELYVEHLVSQNRNAVTDVRYGTTLAELALPTSSVAAGGTMTLLVGNTYYIRLIGFTATQGYEQLESFINIPNTIFRVNSVSTQYSAPSNHTASKLYADACTWENDPNSPNYRACLGVGKEGGNIAVTYQVTILQVPGAPLVNPQPLSTLIYDFSGSSYHYNSDYGVSTRYAFILDPSTLTIAKNFSPDPTNVGGISTLTFTLTNPNAASVSGLNFADTLPNTPGVMTIANPTNASTSGCGSPTFTPVAGATSLSFSNGMIAANSTCTIKVNVTVPVVGTYTNTSNHLFIDSLDTGNFATDPLTVNSAPATPPAVCGLAMAQWTFPAGFSTTSPVPSSSTVTASASPGVGITSTDFTEGADSWGSNGNITVGPTFATTNNEYVQFAVNTTGFSSVALTFDAGRKNTPNSPQGIAVYYGPAVGNPETGTSLYNNATALPTGVTTFSSFGSFSFTPSATTMYVRIYFFNSGNDNSGSDIFVDNVTFTGCATPTPPTITKTFLTNPIPVNGTSTLRFTLSNSNSIPLAGVTFTDALPTGLQVAATPAAATTCGGIPAPTWAPGAGATTLTFGFPLGASIPASSSCTVSVNVTGTASGAYQNVSGFISSTNGGTNTGSTGSASASISVIKPPSIAKLFSPNPILANGTSTLTFTIINPNQNDALTGVAFTDTFPTAPGQMRIATTPNASASNCGTPTFAPVANATSITFTAGTIVAGGTCIVKVDITAPVVGSYANTSGSVSSTNGGTGNTASDTLTINAPNPAIALLKQISISPTGPWSSYITVTPGTNVYYQFTLENSGDVTLSPVSVSDPGISGEESCAWPNTLPVADINDNDHIATCVVGPVVSVSGTIINTATGSGTFGGTPYTSTSSSATYSTPAITLAKSVTETSFDSVGDTLSYSYLVTNSGFAPLLGPVTVTDDKITLPNTVTCPAVNTVGDLDAWFDPGESLTCIATYTVTLLDMAAALVTNTASATISSVTSNDSIVTVYRSLADLTVTKANNVSGSVAQNGTFDWIITVTNSGIADAVFANTNMIMSDTLPGVAGYYPQVPLTVTNGATLPIGTIDCSITGTALSCAASGAVTIPAGGSFSITFTVTPTAAGPLSNTATVDLNGNVLEISETNNTALDTVNVIAPPTVSKSFGAAIIPVGGNTTLTLIVTNPNTNPGVLTNVQVDDTFPAGLTLQNTTFTFTPAVCGTVTNTSGGVSAVGDNNVRFSAASVSVGANCQVVLNVTATTAGTKDNTTGNVTSTNGGTGGTASATVNVVSVAKTIVSTSESSTSFVPIFERVAIGEIVRYRLTTLLPEGTWTNVQITDAIDTGIQFLNDGTATLSYSCDGACSNSTFIITPGTFSSSTDPTFSLGTVTNPDADVNSEFLIVEFNALVLNMTSNAAGGSTRNNSYTISFNGTSITSPSVGVRVVEPSITDLAKTVSPAVGPYYPGDTITYTLTYSNSSTGVNRATAFDIFVTDTLSGNLNLQSVSVVAPTGSTATDTSTSGAGGVVRVLVDRVAPAVDIASGPTDVTISVVAQVMNSAPAGILSNIANLTYTSLPGGVTTSDSNGTCPNITGSCTPGTSGDTTGERNGSGIAPNAYTDVSTIDITISPSADLSITKTDGVTAVAPGGTTTYTIVVTNNGPSAVTGALITDTFPANIISASWNCVASAGSTCITANGVGDINTNADLLVNGTVTFIVTANISAAATGNLVNTATVNPPAGTNDPALANNSASDTDTVINIDAVNDAGSIVNGTVGGQALVNVLMNDTLNGNPATLANINLTQVSTTNSGVTLDVTTGAVNVAPGTPAGNYTLTYQICDQANPTICDIAMVTVPVVVIDAVNDTGSIVSGATGGQSLANVLTNDTLSGNPATLANVNLTQVSTTNPDVTLNVTTGAVNVAPGTPAGNYTVTYQICDQTNPAICDTATVTVPVVVIDAVNDTGSTVNGTVGGQGLANVLTNDTLNGIPATLANVNLSQISTTNAGVTLDVTTGAVNVAPGTPAGNYTVTYQICDQANPTICDTATVTVPVVVIDAVNDTGSVVNGAVGGLSLANVLTNDTLNSNPATLANVNLTQISTTNPGVTLDVTTGAVNVGPGTPAGNYTVTYQICDQANPTICDTATVTVPVVVIDAVNDTGSVVDGTAGGQAFANVLTNDTLNGNPATLANANLTQVSTANPGVTLDITTGAVNVTPGTPAGNYIVTYQICDQANPTICDTATISVPVAVINVVDDDFSSTPVNGYTGGNVGNAFTNDTLNGVSVISAQIVATVITPASNSGVTLNTTTGSVNVAAGTPAGTYTIDYQICDLANPTICDIATITVVVAPPVINAVDDSATGVNGITGATNVLNVFTNDTLNGVSVVPSEVTLTETVPDPSGALTLNLDGSVDVASGTAAGTYQLTYEICEVLNPTNCNTAIVSVTVGLPPAPIAADDSTSTPFNTPATLTNITTNDTAFGTGNSIVISTIDLDPAAGQQTTFTDTSGNQWSVNTTTGDVTFTPALNFTGTATIPYTVQDAARQTATANLSVTVAPPASISGVVFHDVDLDGSKLASESGIVGVIVNLYDSTGTTLIASTTTGAGGTYNFPNLTAGNYLVVEIDPAGYVSSTTNNVPVTVASGGTGTANFGDYQLPNTALSSISGVVFDDVNANGIQEPGEPPLVGVTVQLENNLGVVIGTTTTNASGGYTFTNLPAGTYTVVETDLPGYVSTTLNNIAVTLSAGTNATINFGDQTVVGNPLIADPAVTKLGTPSSAVVGDVVVYTITVGNNGNTNATNVILTDTKPAFLDIISILISPNPGLNPVISGNTFTINFGTVAPTDFYTITVITRVNAQGVPPGGVNNAAITTSSGTDRTFNNASAAQLIIALRGGNPSTVAAITTLPDTGFAPNVVTSLPMQPSDMRYAATDLLLEIPSLGVKMPIVGISKKNGAWDVTWLGKQAGWLEGTAFPSWHGNSVLTGHVYDANGLPGPFVNLGKLKYGDKIIVHAYGQKYTFEVRTNQTVAPDDTSALKHEEKSWLTLVTCKEYDEKTDTYKKRVIVRAVLVTVDWDK